MWQCRVQVAAVAVPIRVAVVLRWEAVSVAPGSIGGTSGLSPRDSVSRLSVAKRYVGWCPCAGQMSRTRCLGCQWGRLIQRPFSEHVAVWISDRIGDANRRWKSPRSGATTTPITTNGVTPGSVALLDLGGGESLSVSKAVADSLVAAWNDVGATSSSNTDSVSESVQRYR